MFIKRCVIYSCFFIVIFALICQSVPLIAATTQEAIASSYEKGLLLYKQGQYKEAYEEFSTCLSLTQQEKERYYREGLSLYEQGKYKEAEIEFQKAILMTENEKDQYYKKGLLLYNEGKYKEAEVEFQKAIVLTGSEKDQHYKRGMIFYNQAKYQEAEEEFQKAVIWVEADKEQYYKKGLSLFNQGRFQEAEEEFRKAIENIKQGQEIAKKPVEEAAKKPGEEPAQEFITVPKREQPYVNEYIIGNADTLIVKVWQNPDLDDEVIVRPDGMISFPLVGDIPAADLTIRQLKGDITEKLKEYVKSPQVSVSIKNIGGKRVIVLGQVRNPGVYTVIGAKTTLEAIGLAGGFTEDAVVSSVMLVKGGFAKPVPKRLNLTKALDRADIRDNLILESEDMIYVPRKFIKDINYFLKQFLEPVYQGAFVKRELRDF